MDDVYRLPNGQLIDAECLSGAINLDAPLPTWQDYQDWLAAISKLVADGGKEDQRG